jgi:hypothetical protein
MRGHGEGELQMRKMILSKDASDRIEEETMPSCRESPSDLLPAEQMQLSPISAADISNKENQNAREKYSSK